MKNTLGHMGLRVVFGVALCVGTGDARILANSCADVDLNKNATDLTVLTPALKYTVTNFDPSWFDTDHPENSPTLFVLTISPRLAASANSLQLRVQVIADTSLGRDPATGIVAFDRFSTPLDGSKIGIPLRSNDVFALTFVSGEGTSFQSSELFNLIAKNHVAPEMNLQFKFSLTCETDRVLANAFALISVDALGGSIGRLRYVKMIQALYPGTQITNPVPVPLYTVTPIFKVASELFNSSVFDYPPDQSKIEIFIYEIPNGIRPQDAMDGLEFAKFGVSNESPVVYPANQPRLEPGVTYAWRARALLRGPTSDYLYSNPLYFKVDERLEGGATIPSSELSDLTSVQGQIKYGDDYSKRVMAALKIILGDNFEIFDVSRGGKIPAKGQIRLNGHPYSLEELERLAREFHQSQHSLTRLRFQ